MNQKGLAEAVGVAQGTVTGWMKGANPKMEQMVRVAEFFAVPLADLVSGSQLRIQEASEAADVYGAGVGGQAAFEQALLVKQTRDTLKGIVEQLGILIDDLDSRPGYVVKPEMSIEEESKRGIRRKKSS